MPRVPSVPSYRLHRPSGQAVVTIRTAGGGRRDVYLGLFNSPESRAEYGRLVAEQASGSVVNQKFTTARTTVDELLLGFLKHASTHYRRADGTATGQVSEFKTVAKVVHALYGHVPAAEFGPLALKAVRAKLVANKNCRTTVNARVGKVRQIWRWGVANELVPAEVYVALAAVAGLQEGRADVRESEPVGPVPPAVVEATLPHLNRHVRGLVAFQRFTGSRPGEAVALRRCDIDTSGPTWTYAPLQHKTRHHGKKRVIPIGPKCQALLATFFTDSASDYLFSPRRAVVESGGKPGKWKVRYSRQSYLEALTRACDKAGVERWHPNQLRHLFATEVRRDHGLEAAQVLLGHSRADVTQVYAQKNQSLAARVAAEIG